MSSRISKKPRTISRKYLNEHLGGALQDLEKRVRADTNEQMFQMCTTIGLHVLAEHFGFDQEKSLQFMSLLDDQYGRIIESPYAYDEIVNEVKEMCAVEIFPGEGGTWWKKATDRAVDNLMQEGYEKWEEAEKLEREMRRENAGNVSRRLGI